MEKWELQFQRRDVEPLGGGGQECPNQEQNSLQLHLCDIQCVLRAEIASMIGELYKDKRENSAAFLDLGSSAGRSSIATIPLPSPHLRQALLACSNIACFGELGQVCCLRLCKSCRYIHSYLCCPQGTGPAESQCKRAFVDCFVPWLKVTLLFLLWASFEFSAHFCLGSHLRMRPLSSYLKHLSSISICFILSCPPLLCRFASLSHHAYIPSVRWHTTF